MLEERGAYAEALEAREAAWPHLYTAGYRACSRSQVDFVLQRVAGSGEPVIDVASGQGHLVERLARHTQRPVVATDFSPRVLRRNRRWFQFLGLYDRLSLLAFDGPPYPVRGWGSGDDDQLPGFV